MPSAVDKTAIKLFRSVTAGKRPTALVDGEVFLNEADGVLCYPDETGTIRQSWLTTDRGIPKTITAATYTVINTDQYLIFTNTAGVTLTLPTPNAANAGRTLTIKNMSALGAITSPTSIVASLLSTVLGTAVLSAGVGKWAKLVSDGAKWVTMEGN